MGLRYLGISASDNAQFFSEDKPQRSPVYCVEQSLTSSRHSAPAFYSNEFPPAMANCSSYSNFLSSHLPSDISNYSLPDFSSLDMLPPSRYPHLPQISASMPARDPYRADSPELRRHFELLARSPPPAGKLRNITISPASSSGFTTPQGLNSRQPAIIPNGPLPLSPTELLYQNMQTTDGQQVRPEIIGKFGKEFFLAENDWTCYRRNYMQISCLYTLHPSVPEGTTMHLLQEGQSAHIQAFAVSISAVVDEEHGKPIELVQHTPKRGKGPQMKPNRVVLLPLPVNTTPSNKINVDGTLSTGGRPLFDPNYAPDLNRVPTDYTFKRIQFKQATANNGKRQARQQYYHLIIELFADLGSQQGDGRWAKIARRVSARIIVRGRSPVHHHTNKIGNNASAGP